MARWCFAACKKATKPFKPLRAASYPTLQQDTDEKRMLAALPLESSEVTDDTTDVALAASGDRRAFERLYRKHETRVYSLCARMAGSAMKGEELTQDVFVRTWEK